MRTPKNGEYVGKKNDGVTVCGDHSLKGGVKALEKDLESGVPHESVREMKGLDKR